MLCVCAPLLEGGTVLLTIIMLLGTLGESLLLRFDAGEGDRVPSSLCLFRPASEEMI